MKKGLIKFLLVVSGLLCFSIAAWSDEMLRQIFILRLLTLQSY